MIEQSFDIRNMLKLRNSYSKQLVKVTNDELIPSYAVFLSAMENHDFTSQHELCETIGCNKAHTSRTVLKMQLKGLVNLSFKKISLTERGKQLAKVVNEFKINFFKKIMANISQEDKVVFERVMKQIYENIDAMTEKKE